MGHLLSPVPPLSVLGRFDPPTAADLAALDACRADAGAPLGICLVARPTDTFAPHVRLRWLRDLAAPGDRIDVLDERDDGANALVLPLDRLLPPDASDARWRLPTGPGEAVKADPMGRWDDLPAPVRPAFVRRIRLFGAESSGKSTMAAHLARAFGTVWVPEQWRRLYVKHGHRWEPEHVLEVATAQLEAEEQAARQANRLLVCDTDALMTLLYARTAFGTAPAFLQALCDSPGYTDRYAATLLFAPDLPWEPDPVREGPDARERYFRLFRDELDVRRIPYTLVAGAGRAREAVAEAAVRSVLAAAPCPAPG